MGFLQIISSKHRVCITQLYGRITGDQVLEAYHKLVTHEQFDQTYHQLWDTRRIEELDMDWPVMQAFRHIAETGCTAPELEQCKTAVVANRHLVHISARSVLTMMRDSKCEKKIFWSYLDALEWLELNPDDLALVDV